MWYLVDGHLTNYEKVKVDPEFVSVASNFLPFNTYKTELDKALLPGTGGWNEVATSQPPYQELFHESESLYKSFNHNNLIKHAVVKDVKEKLTVNGAEGAEVLKSIYFNGIKRPVDTYSNFLEGGYDDVGYVKDFRSRLRKAGEQSGLWGEPLYTLADSLAFAVDNHLGFGVFSSLWTRFDARLHSTSTTEQVQMYNDMLAPYTSLDELFSFSTKLSSCASYDYFYSGLLSERNYVVTSTGEFKQRMELSPYLASGKRLQFTSNEDFTASVNIFYKNGSPAISRTVSVTENHNGIKKGFLNLTELPDYTNISELVLSYTYGAGNAFIIPEGCEFVLSFFDSRGLLVKEVNEKGEKLHYGYDLNDRLEYIRDKDNNVLKYYKYHQVTQ